MIEHEGHSHGHRTGVPLVDVILAGSAIFISIVSLMVSIHHGRTMEKLVAANEKQVKASTLPILRYVTGNVTNSQRMIHFQVTNGGIGPAIIEWFRLKWDGQPTTSPQDLLERCCGGGKPVEIKNAWNDVASGTTLPARDMRNVFAVPATGVDPAIYKILNDEARYKVEAEACYCSVLDECWVTDFKNQPRDVKVCERIPENQRW